MSELIDTGRKGWWQVVIVDGPRRHVFTCDEASCREFQAALDARIAADRTREGAGFSVTRSLFREVGDPKAETVDRSASGNRPRRP